MVVSQGQQAKAFQLDTSNIKLFNDFFNVSHGYIVRDLMKEDLDQLDKEEQE